MYSEDFILLFFFLILQVLMVCIKITDVFNNMCAQTELVVEHITNDEPKDCITIYQ